MTLCINNFTSPEGLRKWSTVQPTPFNKRSRLTSTRDENQEKKKNYESFSYNKNHDSREPKKITNIFQPRVGRRRYEGLSN